MRVRRLSIAGDLGINVVYQGIYMWKQVLDGSVEYPMKQRLVIQLDYGHGNVEKGGKPF